MDEFAALARDIPPAPAKPAQEFRCPHCGIPVGKLITVYEVRQGCAGMWTVLVEYGRENERTYAVERRCSCGQTYSWRTSKPACKHTAFE
jgi:hypothetical protein